VGVVLLVGGISCNREDDTQVRQVNVPKEARASAAGGADGAVAEDHSGHEEIAWEVPAGWRRLAGGSEQMRHATFQVSEAHPDVVVTVVPLGAEAGSLLDNVNRWEGQLGLPASSEGDLGKVTKPVETQAGPGVLVDLRSAAAGDKPATRVLAAVIKRGAATWFYKMSGPADVVGGQEEKFVAFTRSTHFDHNHEGHAHAETPAASPAGGASAGGTASNLPAGHPPVAPGQQAPRLGGSVAGGGGAAGLTYTLPAGWEKQADRPMRDATFAVTVGGEKAEVILSHFPQGTGDLLSNVNRWRNQVGLAPLEKVDPNTGQAVTIAGAEGRLHDFAGPEVATPRLRQMVATVNKSGSEWFIKIIGPYGAVESQRESFVQFLSSVRLGD
jgi:hypothetical protein